MKSRPKPRVIPGSKPAPRPRPRGNFRKTTPPAEVEICILAGGLSTRMGRDKANLRIGGRTLLAHIRSTAKALGLPVRVIRCDLVPRCGPLGGIYTALKTTAADAVLFLACDMPCVTETLLQTVLRKNKSRTTAVFTVNQRGAGFPMLLKRSALPTVERQLAEQQFSLRKLSQALDATSFRPGSPFKADLMNVNTPGDWNKLESAWPKNRR